MNTQIPVNTQAGTAEKKLKPCCACPETKKLRDACVFNNGEENQEQTYKIIKQVLAFQTSKKRNFSPSSPNIQLIQKSFCQATSQQRKRLKKATGLQKYLINQLRKIKMIGDDHDHSKLDVNKIVKMQNFIFFVFAYCTKKVYENDTCVDDSKEMFLNWVLYGNLAICLILLIGYFLSKVPSIYTFLNRCGAVCVTIQMYIFYGSLVIFHFTSMIYGISKHFWSKPTECKELQLFLMVCAYVYVVWIFMYMYAFLMKLAQRFFPEQPNYNVFLSGGTVQSNY
ncbi:hypothetical protein ABPG72_010796 [Tetrahymena utriculariae]